MTFSLTTLTAIVVLFAIQMVAALPWVMALTLAPGDLALIRRRGPESRQPWIKLQAGLMAVGGTLLLGLLGLFLQERGSLRLTGYFYAAILQVQLTVDAFILLFAAGLKVWPKGSAVAQAAFREGVRQPMFWLLAGLAFAALTISPYIPYFTFGEDHLVVKELGYDTVMLAAVLFGTLAASLSISEEIEGRTAVTLMSKPISRRQFLLGKFLGITAAALFMFGLLGCYFEGILLYKHWWDQLDPVPAPAWLSDLLARGTVPAEVQPLLEGAGLWLVNGLETLPGLVLGFCQVMVLIAFAVTLATRVPMVVNLSTILVIYFLAHLTPVLVLIGQQAQQTNPESTVSQLLAFTSQLFDTLLPALSFFRISPVLVSDNLVTTWPFVQYVASVVFHGMLYTSIVLLVGLFFFEDRDLA